MTGETLEPTRGKLERSLSQGIQALYRSQLGLQTSHAVCNLLDNKLIIVIENGVTQPEKLLAQNGQQDLALQVRSQLESVLELQLKDLIKEVLGVEVTDCSAMRLWRLVAPERSQFWSLHLKFAILVLSLKLNQKHLRVEVLADNCF